MVLAIRPAQVAYIDSTQTFSGAKTFTANLTITDVDIVLSATTGTKIGTATTQKLGFYNAVPIIRGAAVTDPTGGATVDAESRTAIIALNDRLQAVGIIA
jgi:hypothetical protein